MVGFHCVFPLFNSGFLCPSTDSFYPIVIPFFRHGLIFWTQLSPIERSWEYFAAQRVKLSRLVELRNGFQCIDYGLLHLSDKIWSTVSCFNWEMPILLSVGLREYVCYRKSLCHIIWYVHYTFSGVKCSLKPWPPLEIKTITWGLGPYTLIVCHQGI